MSILLCLTLLLPQGGDAAAAGAQAWREGRYRDALASFTAAVRAAGEDAAAELLHNQALAALRAGAPREAELAAERAAARGGPEFAGLREFVRGNAAFARCLVAAAQAASVEAEPFAFDVAIAHAEAARAAWQRALLQRGEWPEARRNVERAQRKLTELREAKAAADRRRREEARKAGEPEPKPLPVQPDPSEPAPEPEGPKEETETEVQPQLQELRREEVRRLLDTLAAKEQEKRALRRREQQTQRVPVEKDW
ncbi:MAG: hypothetical protein IT458_12290 [Planctomycetes bacterium]|nr:hypothetical protein [Planctomycetota bacterium]